MVAALVIIAVAATAIVMLLAHKPSQATASPSATGKGGAASGAAAAPVGQAKAAASGPATFSGPDIAALPLLASMAPCRTSKTLVLKLRR